jgi:tRNA (guanine-N7-)-methyltransferase
MSQILDISEFVEKKPDWRAIFGNAHPIKVEIGPGKGDFLIQSALQSPDFNFLGLEIRRKRVEKINSKLCREGLTNAKIVPGDAKILIHSLFLPESVDTFFIHFPDPWPKRRHGKHRLIEPVFVETLCHILVPQGKVYLTTDADYYATTMSTIFASHFMRQYAYSDDLDHPYHHTFHEWKFKLEGRKIYYFCFTKI